MMATILFKTRGLFYNQLNRMSRNMCYSVVAQSKISKTIKLKIFSLKSVSNRGYKYTSMPQIRSETPASSRYHPISPIEGAEEKIKNLFKDIDTLTPDEWNEMKIKLFDEHNVLTEINMDSVLMNCMLAQDKIELAHSFMRYLKENKFKTNFLTYLKYMVLCSKHIETCGEEIILKSFKKVRQIFDSSPVLDAKRVECVTQGLCATSEWRTSLVYLKKLHSKPTFDTMNALACAAVRNDDEAFAWEIITKWFSNPEFISQSVFKEYIKFFSSKKKSLESDSFIKKLFKFLHDNCIIINQAVAKEIEIYFASHRFKWKISYSKMDQSSQCSGCKEQLLLLDLTNEEFRLLKKSFLEKSVMKSDVFINTTERELQIFLNFIEENKPFHIVVDGLNAAHSDPSIRNNWILAKQLLKVVKLLSKTSKNILIMGRHHMRFWPRTTLQYIKERALMFFTHNVSQDDPFLVYAALASGPHTLILSGDMMRDHLARLDDPKLMQLFRRWQQSHQIYIPEASKNVIKFKGPLKHSIKLQGNMEKGWHIPFDDDIILDPYEELNNWLCIQRLCY